ncbi:hypothetical protein [Mycoplasma miroungirhinis]|uniref:Septation ring formation regulator n=1 Tax=Mycoplasma miroungirhinis TaxID=754516 RepID=A0A6M4JAT6_9MOLU|nr:hypothetical protein [Mycoplasma miroungirhinis]QJR44083.1 hypothetical protein HLA92_01370 [Mycoplasma miroungirhinis]
MKISLIFVILILIFLISLLTFLWFTWVFNYYKKFGIEKIILKTKKNEKTLKSFTQTLYQFELFSKNDNDFKKIYDEYVAIYTTFKAKHSKLMFSTSTLKNTIYFTFNKKILAILKELKQIDNNLRQFQKEIKELSLIERDINLFIKKRTKNTDLIIHHSRLLFSFFRKLSNFVKYSENKYEFFSSEIKFLETEWTNNYLFFQNNEFTKNSSNVNFAKLENLNLILLNYAKILNEAYGLKMFLDFKINDFFKIKNKLKLDYFQNFVNQYDIDNRLQEIENLIKNIKSLFAEKQYLKNSKNINNLFADVLQKINEMIHQFNIEEKSYKYLQNTNYNKDDIEHLLKNLDEQKQEILKNYQFFQKNNQLTNAMEQNILNYKSLEKNNFWNDFLTLISERQFTNQKMLSEILFIIKEINNQFNILKDLKNQFSPLNDVISKMKKYEFKFLVMQSEIKILNLELTEIEIQNIENIKNFNTKIKLKNQQNHYDFETLKEDIDNFVVQIQALEASIGLKIESYKLFQIFITFFNRYRSSMEEINNLCLNAEKSVESGKYFEAIDKIYKHIERQTN